MLQDIEQWTTAKGCRHGAVDEEFFRVISLRRALWFVVFENNKIRRFVFARKEKKTNISFMSDCPSAWNNSASTGRILIKLDI